MPSFTMPEVFRIDVQAECPTHARTEVAARGHRLVIDEPPARNGTDLGATPLETLLASYLGCTNVIANMLAQEMGFEIRAMSLRATGHFDTRGVFNKAEVTVPFPRIDLDVQVVTEASQADVEALARALARRCPVSVVLRKAGSDIVETWTAIHPSSASGGTETGDTDE